MAFSANLDLLPQVEGKRLVLLDGAGAEVAVITNAPGTAGSFRVYAYLAAKYGAINANAAQKGLEIYADHTDDARLNPGKHPNIDRLLDCIGAGRIYAVEIL